IETADRRIAWPPAGAVVMNAFGFREAFARADEVILPSRVTAKVVSIPGLALLKIVSWQDRHMVAPRKDVGARWCGGDGSASEWRISRPS
ncbi:MAG: hypothetical protein ACRETT_15030, partial [Steroidobacteraceae bacterium]